MSCADAVLEATKKISELWNVWTFSLLMALVFKRHVGNILDALADRTKKGGLLFRRTSGQTETVLTIEASGIEEREISE